MAKPSKQDGYIQAPYEWLLGWLASFGLQGVVLGEVFKQVHGLARLDAATLSPTDIAERSKSTPSNVSKAIRKLVAKGMLEKAGGQSYRLVDDYERWDLGEKSEAREARIAYCRDAPRHAKSFRPGDSRAIPGPSSPAQQQLPFHDDPPGRLPAPEMIQMDHQSDVKHDPNGSSNMIQMDHKHDPNGSSNMIQMDHQNTLAIEERTRGIENLRENRELFLLTHCVSSSEEENKKSFSSQEESGIDLAARWQAIRGGMIRGH